MHNYISLEESFEAIAQMELGGHLPVTGPSWFCHTCIWSYMLWKVFIYLIKLSLTYFFPVIAFLISLVCKHQHCVFWGKIVLSLFWSPGALMFILYFTEWQKGLSSWLIMAGITRGLWESIQCPGLKMFSWFTDAMSMFCSKFPGSHSYLVCHLDFQTSLPLFLKKSLVPNLPRCF